MSTSIGLTTALKNSALDTVFDNCNTGYIRIYNGTRPANANTAVSTQTLLAELRFGATAFAAASSGSKVANAITSTTDAAATGTATWTRFLKSDGTTVVGDGDVGVTGAGAVLELPTVSIQQHATVQVSSLTITA